MFQTVKLISSLLLGFCATITGGPAQASPMIAGCHIFPEDNIWNQAVDTLPVDKSSALYIQTIGGSSHLHPDFGSGLWNGAPIGIPFVNVSGSQPLVDVSFLYADESDPGPYPIPPDAPIEGGADGTGDRHVLVLDRDDCVLYELFYAFLQEDGTWTAGSGAIFGLDSNTLRPRGWTSADAAGLPILPGLVRYDEVASGEIRHALRFTAPETRRDYVWPARHYASSLTGSQYPPMGQRFRLRAQFGISEFSEPVQVILQALKTYGAILADNGSPWYFSGVPDERWDNDILAELSSIDGSNFEAVDVAGLMVDADSAGISDASIDGCPAGDPVSIELVTYPDGSIVDCHKTISISAGQGVLVGAGSIVTYSSPVVILQGGFRVARNGEFNVTGH